MSQRGGESERAKKVSRIIWMAPKWLPKRRTLKLVKCSSEHNFNNVYCWPLEQSSGSLVADFGNDWVKSKYYSSFPKLNQSLQKSCPELCLKIEKTWIGCTYLLKLCSVASKTLGEYVSNKDRAVSPAFRCWLSAGNQNKWFLYKQAKFVSTHSIVNSLCFYYKIFNTLTIPLFRYWNLIQTHECSS